jgi:hypothetical protein
MGRSRRNGLLLEDIAAATGCLLLCSPWYRSGPEDVSPTNHFFQKLLEGSHQNGTLSSTESMSPKAEARRARLARCCASLIPREAKVKNLGITQKAWRQSGLFWSIAVGLTLR